MHPELFLAFSLSICPPWVMVNNHYCHVLPFVTFEIEVFPYWFIDFLGLNGRTVIIDSSAEIPRFPNILFLTNLSADQIYAVVCLTGQAPQNSIAAACNWAVETDCIRAVLTEKASSIRTSFKTPVR